MCGEWESTDTRRDVRKVVMFLSWSCVENGGKCKREIMTKQEESYRMDIEGYAAF